MCVLLYGIRIQDYQMVYFQTKNPIFDEFWKALEWKKLVHFVTFLVM
jgi:hypothetical protein